MLKQLLLIAAMAMTTITASAQITYSPDLEAKAKKDPEAMYRLAYCYANSIDVWGDLKKANKLAEKSSKSGCGFGSYLKAMLLLDEMDQYPQNSPKREKLSASYKTYKDLGLQQLRPLADNGNMEAKYCISKLMGKGAESDKLMREAAEGNYGEAQYETGMRCLEKGDKEEAFRWFSKAADNGSDNGLIQQALCYLDGIGTEINKTRGMELLKQAAEKGNVNAICTFVQRKKDPEKNIEEQPELATLLAKAVDKTHKDYQKRPCQLAAEYIAEMFQTIEDQTVLDHLKAGNQYKLVSKFYRKESQGNQNYFMKSNLLANSLVEPALTGDSDKQLLCALYDTSNNPKFSIQNIIEDIKKCKGKEKEDKLDRLAAKVSNYEDQSYWGRNHPKHRWHNNIQYFSEAAEGCSKEFKYYFIYEYIGYLDKTLYFIKTDEPLEKFLHAVIWSSWKEGKEAFLELSNQGFQAGTCAYIINWYDETGAELEKKLKLAKTQTNDTTLLVKIKERFGECKATAAIREVLAKHDIKEAQDRVNSIKGAERKQKANKAEEERVYQNMVKAFGKKTAVALMNGVPVAGTRLDHVRKFNNYFTLPAYTVYTYSSPFNNYTHKIKVNIAVGSVWYFATVKNGVITNVSQAYDDPNNQRW